MCGNTVLGCVACVFCGEVLTCPIVTHVTRAQWISDAHWQGICGACRRTVRRGAAWRPRTPAAACT